MENITINIKSPCIKFCELDYNTETCKGCFRNIEEIGHWWSYNNSEKQKILDLIQLRKKS